MTRVSRAAAALLAAAAFVSGALPVLAHEGAVDVRPVLDRVVPPQPALRVEVAQSVAPVVGIENLGDEDLVVLGEQGEPFLRLGHERAELNVASPTAAAALNPAQAPPPGAPGEPEWREVNRRAAWSWYDPRLRVLPARASSRWTIPMRMGEREVRAEGRVVRIERHGHVEAAVTGIEPARPRGLELRVLQGAVPGFFVRNETGELLEVPGLEGEPFLRIGPDGVEGNARSPSFYRAGVRTVREVPADADPRAPPSWQRLSSVPVWAWLEYRAQPPVESAEELGGRPRTLAEWTTPMTLDGRRLDVEGRLRWVPAASPAAEERFPWRWAVAALAAVSAIAGGVLWAARRVRRGREAAAEPEVEPPIRTSPDGGSTPPASGP